MSPRAGYIEVEGGRVWYRISGAGNEIPLILLHGGPGAPSYYLNPLEGVSKDRPVVFYDQLGAGRSDRPIDVSLWTIGRFVRELDNVRDALGLAQIHLFGHSWGSMLALDYMLTKPEGVRSLILASPVMSARRWAEDADRLLGQLPNDLQMAIRDHDAASTTDDPAYEEAMMEYYKRYFSRSDPWSPDLQRAFAELNTDLYGLMWGPSELAATGTLKDYEREEVLPNLDLPVLFTTGRYDEATPATVEHYKSLVPDSRLAIFENSAHMTMLDEPLAYVETIREFLNNVDSDS